MSMNTEEALQFLQAQQAAAQLPPNDKTFVESLLAHFERRGALSEKQWAWVITLAERIAQPPVPIDLGTFTGVYTLLRTAQQHLKYPKIQLTTPEGPLVLALAGPRSKQPNTVTVTDGGGYGSGEYLGRVYEDGRWEKPRRPVQRDLDTVQEWLLKLAEDAPGTALASAQLSGACCFCSKTLTDKRSTDRGYGPRCAEVWQLPWG